MNLVHGTNYGQKTSLEHLRQLIIFPIYFHKWREIYFFGNEFFCQLISFPKKVYPTSRDTHEEVATRACRINRFCLYMTNGHLLCPPLVWKAFAPKYAIITKQYKGIPNPPCRIYIVSKALIIQPCRIFSLYDTIINEREWKEEETWFHARPSVNT